MANTPNAQTLQPRAAVDTARFDAISLTLYNLTEIVKLAAFAAEARRTLTCIHDTLHYRQEMKQVICDSVSNSAQWAELEDNTADVLDYVARQLRVVNREFDENFYGPSPARTAMREAEKIGVEA